LKTYRQYLLGRRFVIRTDHSALQSLRKTPEPIGQQARWQTFIKQLTFTITHRPGTQHRNADALSRRPNDDDEDGNEAHDRCGRVTATQTEEKGEPTTGDHPTASAGETMTELQQQDPDIGPILRRFLKQKEQPRPEEMITESAATKVLWGQWYNLTVVDEVLYRKVQRYNGQTLAIQLIVPAVKRTEFIARCHEGMT